MNDGSLPVLGGSGELPDITILPEKVGIVLLKSLSDQATFKPSELRFPMDGGKPLAVLGREQLVTAEDLVDMIDVRIADYIDQAIGHIRKIVKEELKEALSGEK